MKLSRSAWIIVILVLSRSVSAQYNGGIGDGSGISSGFMSLNSQQYYCAGGSGDGFCAGMSAPISLNSQYLYCSGGIGDGFSGSYKNGAALNDQLLYCNGGPGDGHSVNSSGIIPLNSQGFYCIGGSGDGFSSGLSVGSVNDQLFYCSGGTGDGHYAFTIILALNDQSPYCSGGLADGNNCAGSGTITLNDQSLYCTGSSGDGYSRNLYTGTINDQTLYCAGGYGDGHSHYLFTGSLFNQSFFCSGGTGDGFSHGFSTLTPFGAGIWRGLVSSEWNTPGNWTNNVIPDYTIGVIIPPGCTYYPSLSGTLNISSSGGAYSAKSIEIRDGGFVANTGSLSIHGSMTVAGSYVATNSLTHSQLISPGGSLTIPSTGSVLLGNQSSGAGSCDLIVDYGGILTVEGGILEIDDQFIVHGNFNMAGGQVFAGKYGLGSDYGSGDPASFYIASDATGSISGGRIRVAGRQTVNDTYTAVSLNSPALDFTAAAWLEICNGINIVDDETELRVVPGEDLRFLVINRPARVVLIGSDITCTANLVIRHACTLRVKQGSTVTVNGNLILQN